MIPADLDNIWDSLWHTHFDDYPRLRSLALSYEAYLKGKRNFFEKQLSLALGIPVLWRSDAEDYVAWVGLGPSLVEGFRRLHRRDSDKETAARISKTIRELSQKPFDWSSDLIRIIDRLKLMGGYWLNGGENYLEWTTKVIDLLRATKSDENPVLMLSYLLGVVSQKDPWDPPECTSAALNMISKGIKDLLYRTQLTALLSQATVSQQLLVVLSGWLRQEEMLRSNLREAWIHVSRER